MAGRYRKYRTDKALRSAVESYFKSISRERVVKECYNTGQKDGWGHFVYEWRAVTTDDGALMIERVFFVPPTRGGLIDYLKISRDTWWRYCDHEENPQFAETTEWAEEQLLAWREKELLKRPGKMLRGLEVDLNANYGYGAKIAAGGKAEDKKPAKPPMSLGEKLSILKEIGAAVDFGEDGGPDDRSEEG